MTSTLDALTTLYRLLILVSATVLAIAVYYEPNPYSFTAASETVKRVTAAYLEFVGEVRANATAKYRSQILPLVADRPQLEQAIVKKAQFLPYSVSIADESQQIEQHIPIGDPEISLSWVLFTSTPNMSHPPRGSYPIFTLDHEQVRDTLKNIVGEPDLTPLYSTDDLVVYLIPPQRGTDSYCTLYFHSPQWEKANLARSVLVKCKKQKDQDISALLQGFRNTAWQYGYSPPWPGGIPKFTALPFPLAQSKIDALAKKETEDAKVEFLGPKLTIAGVLNIGPMLIIAILLLMLVHTRTILLLPENEPADGAAWFGLFLLWLPLLTAIPVLVVLPTIATATALAAGYEQPFDLPTTLDWWEPRLLWSQRWFIGGTLLVASLSIWLLAANFRASRAWFARLAAAKAASWEA